MKGKEKPEKTIEMQKETKQKENKTKKITPKKVILIVLAIILLAIISFITYEIATVNNTYYIGEKNLQIPIFVYHNIVDKDSEIKYDYMQTTTKTFENQITGLMKLGFKPIRYKDLVEYKKGDKAIPKRSFIITFDDGCEGVYKNAYPIAKKYNIPMTAFIIDENMEKDGVLTWKQTKEMKDSGLISIYSHGLVHREYDKESKKKLLSETNQAYENIYKNLGDRNILKVFTYPYGLNTQEGREELEKAGYIQNLTDNKVNQSKNLDLSGLHRCYPLEDSVLKIILKMEYRSFRYGG